MAPDMTAEELWRTVFTVRNPQMHRQRHTFRLIPSDPRCKFCYAPFGGIGKHIMNVFFHKRPSSLNPSFCNICDEWARQYPGGAEVEMSYLFADVRGSTSIAEKMTPSEFSALMDRFYSAMTGVITRTDGMMEKFIGDEVAAFYAPAFVGPNHALAAVEAARDILHATGHGSAKGPWLPVGVGVHTGVAFAGAVGQGGVTQITALGDAVNTAARLASSAGAGEILVSDATYAAAGLALPDPEHRDLELKGKSEMIGVYVLRENTPLPPRQALEPT